MYAKQPGFFFVAHVSNRGNDTPPDLFPWLTFYERHGTVARTYETVADAASGDSLWQARA